ncbi:MAG: serine hydroxymethyltransferase, partial [Acidilobaceae archaeon]
QEVTRIGMKESEISYIAELFYKVLIVKKDPVEVRSEVEEFRKQYSKVYYCFDEKEAPKILTLLDLLS